MEPILGSEDPDTLPGSEGADSIFGFGGGDEITALGGNDEIFGGAGFDRIWGGLGRDTILGGAGNDRIWGGGNADKLQGEGGDDVIRGGGGGDYIVGGRGSDAIHGEAGDDTIYGGSESHGFSLDGLDGFNRLFGGSGDDVLVIRRYVGGSALAKAGSGDDRVEMDLSAAGSSLFGGTGTDTLELSTDPDGPNAGITLLMSSTGTATIRADGTAVATATGFEQLDFLGGDAGDRVRALGRADEIAVDRGDNSVNAGGGNDEVRYVVGGTNTLRGGAGFDKLNIWLEAATTLDLASGTDAFGSSFSGFETFSVQGSSGADTVRGTDGRDVISGFSEADRLVGRGGADELTGDDGDDYLFGGRGADLLQGGIGEDTMFGGAGDDRLVGGQDTDFLFGGAGRDEFVFVWGVEGIDLVTGFQAGTDTIVIESDLIGGALDEGLVDPSRLKIQWRSGADGQFVLTDEGDYDRLVWDGNGALPGGTVEIVRLWGESGLIVADLWIEG